MKDKAPQWTHIISSSKYNAALAKKQLLGNGRQLRVQLAQILEQVSSLRASFEATFTPEDRAEKDMTAVETYESMAEETLLIIAAVNTIENFTGKEAGVTMATDILADDGANGLPEILKKKLRSLLPKK